MLCLQPELVHVGGVGAESEGGLGARAANFYRRFFLHIRPDHLSPAPSGRESSSSPRKALRGAEGGDQSGRRAAATPIVTQHRAAAVVFFYFG